jgi:hypothetical protein
VSEEQEECPRGPDILAAWERGELTTVEAHFADCPSCRELLSASSRMQAMLQTGDPGAGLRATASWKRAALLEECRQSLRPAAATPRQRTLHRWGWSAALGFAAAGLALFLIQPNPRRPVVRTPPTPRTLSAPTTPSTVGQAARVASRLVMVTPALESRPEPLSRRAYLPREQPSVPRGHAPRRLTAAPPALPVRRPAQEAEQPPLVVVEAEGGQPAPDTISVSATGSSAVVTRAAYEETQP